MKFKRTIFSLISLIIAFFSFSALALAAPEVVNYKIDGKQESARINPLRGDVVSIEINTNVPVKFSRIYICKVADNKCNDDDDSSVIYFMTTSNPYASLVTKKWDGKPSDTNKSKGIIVSDGDYKIKVKMKDELSTEYKYIQELSPYIITIDSSFAGGSGGSSSSVSQGSSSALQSGSGAQSSSLATGSVVSTFASVASSYSSSVASSLAVKYSNTFEVGAGSDRLVYTDTPTEFTATVGVPKGFSEQAVKFIWSFGDGGTGEGKKVSHTYKFPGDYIIVLNGSLSETSAASRTNVKVISPSVFISNTASDSVEIANQGAYEINLKGWAVSNSLGKFVFLSDTIIAPNKKITVPDEYMKLNLTQGGKVSLLNPSGKEAGLISGVTGSGTLSNSSVDNSSDSNLDNDPVVKKIREFIATGGKSSVGNKTPVSKKSLSSQAGEISGAKNKNISVSEKDKIISSSTQPASVASSQVQSRGFIRNLLHLPSAGLNLIKKAFYSGN